MSVDHGMLNVPLSKRGNIDRDIDRWKAQEADANKRRARELADLRAQDMATVRACVAFMSDERVMVLARGMGKRKPETARVAVIQRASRNPAAFAAAMRREVGCCQTAPCSRLGGPCFDMASRCAKCRARGGCDCTGDEWLGHPA